jgi:uncharacterized protein (TIGR04255 family)
MHMDDDYIYQSPPLVEVIAEVHWEVQRIVSIPDGGVDPFYTKCLDRIREGGHFADFRHEEHLVPDKVPIDFFANNPIVRFQKKPNTCLLYQLGPGIFAVILVPPYQGWRAFKEALSFGLEGLLKSYPSPSEFLKISRLELKYIDAFRRHHGFDVYSNFVSRGLGLSLQIPAAILEGSVQGGESAVITASDVTFPLKKLEGAQGNIKIGPGKVADEDVVLGQFSCVYQGTGKATEVAELLSWFDGAHFEVRSWFESLVSPTVREKFGSKKIIGD